MQSLYSNGFETIYDAMYQTFIDYELEYEFYSSILKKYKKKQILEIGSGTGNLAQHFIKNNYNYSGLDYSIDMVNLSKSKNPKGTFINGDMTNFSLEEPSESIIITGRTTSYLLNNIDIHNTLKSITKNLTKEGLLCFDFIDASRFFKQIKGGVLIEHKAAFNGKNYYRDSFLNTNTSNNFMFNWDSKYYEINKNNSRLIAQDNSEVRAFTKNEWELFLLLNDFELIEFIDKKSYAFDTYVVVAKKMA